MNTDIPSSTNKRDYLSNGIGQRRRSRDVADQQSTTDPHDETITPFVGQDNSPTKKLYPTMDFDDLNWPSK
jgi:hypothetical protein